MDRTFTIDIQFFTAPSAGMTVFENGTGSGNNQSNTRTSTNNQSNTNTSTNTNTNISTDTNTTLFIGGVNIYLNATHMNETALSTATYEEILLQEEPLNVTFVKEVQKYNVSLESEKVISVFVDETFDEINFSSQNKTSPTIT